MGTVFLEADECLGINGLFWGECGDPLCTPVVGVLMMGFGKAALDGLKSFFFLVCDCASKTALSGGCYLHWVPGNRTALGGLGEALGAGGRPEEPLAPGWQLRTSPQECKPLTWSCHCQSLAGR